MSYRRDLSMKKSVISILIIFLVFTFLTACGNESVDINNEINNFINETNNEVIDKSEDNDIVNGYVSTAQYAPPVYLPSDYDMSTHYDIEIMLKGSGNPDAEN